MDLPETHPDYIWLAGLSALMECAHLPHCPNCEATWRPVHRGFTRHPDRLEDRGWQATRTHHDGCHAGCGCGENLALLDNGETTWGEVGCLDSNCPALPKEA